jgi:hypothetical protein
VSVLKGGWHNPTLIDFPSDALTPIWDYCTDPNRKKQFQDAFDNLAKTHASVISGLSLYKPLYLYQGQVNGGVTYRLYENTNLAGSRDAGGIAWTIQNDGKAFLNVAAKQTDGTIPLYQYRVSDQPNIWRYETSPWLPPEEGDFSRLWERVSSTPIGYVLDPTKNPA